MGIMNDQTTNARARVASDDVDVAAGDLEAVRQEVAVEMRKACVDLKRIENEMKLHEGDASC